MFELRRQADNSYSFNNKTEKLTSGVVGVGVPVAEQLKLGLGVFSFVPYSFTKRMLFNLSISGLVYSNDSCGHQLCFGKIKT